MIILSIYSLSIHNIFYNLFPHNNLYNHILKLYKLVLSKIFIINDINNLIKGNIY